MGSKPLSGGSWPLVGKSKVEEGNGKKTSPKLSQRRRKYYLIGTFFLQRKGQARGGGKRERDGLEGTVYTNYFGALITLIREGLIQPKNCPYVGQSTKKKKLTQGRGRCFPFLHSEGGT